MSSKQNPRKNQAGKESSKKRPTPSITSNGSSSELLSQEPEPRKPTKDIKNTKYGGKKNKRPVEREDGVVPWKKLNELSEEEVFNTRRTKKILSWKRLPWCWTR